MRQLIENLIARGTVVLANAATGIQRLQLKLLSGETKDNIEHFEPYGFTSRPKNGAEHVTLFLDGDRSHGITIVVADRRFRLKGLVEGEVALFDDLGQKVHLTRNGIVVDGGTHPINIKTSGNVTIDGGGSGATKGCVQGDCICAYTGQPHPMVSATVKASK